MRKIALNILIVLISFSFLSFANSEEEKSNNTELNLFTGVLILVMINKRLACLVCSTKMMICSEKVFWEDYRQTQEVF